jgi:hypothetical protein
VFSGIFGETANYAKNKLRTGLSDKNVNNFSFHADKFWQNSSTITLNCVQTSTNFVHF